MIQIIFYLNNTTQYNTESDSSTVSETWSSEYFSMHTNWLCPCLHVKTVNWYASEKLETTDYF